VNDDLTRRLRAADPAAALPPAGPERVARLLEDTMDNRTSPTETTPTRRSPLPWLAAAAVVALVAVLGIWTLGDGDPSPAANAPTSAPASDASSPTASPTTSPKGDTTTTLTAPAAGEAGRCLPPTAEYLREANTAFDGEVVALEDGLATIVVDEWYAGEPTDRVVVRAPSENMQALIAAVDFEEGGRYLVAAGESGFVMVCGFSAPYDDGLAAMYAEAFGG